MKMKKVIAVCLAAFMCFTMLAACANDSPPTPTPAPTEPAPEPADPAPADPPATGPEPSPPGLEPVTLRVLAGQSTTDVGTERLIDEAMARAHPHITLEWELVDWGRDFQPRMMLHIQSDTIPDVMIGKAQDVATFSDLLGDLTGLPFMGEVLDAAIPGVTVDGRVLGIVYNALYQGVFYNRALFNEFNVQIPNTLDELQAAIDIFNENDITPFATHFVDVWSIGNITMQFAMNEVFRDTPDWGDLFRAGERNFVDSEEYRNAYLRNMLIFENTWQDLTFSMEQTECDARKVLGEAAMKVSGSWSVQNFLDVDPNYDFGIFPFPNEAGDAKLLFEPNITFMKSADSPHQEAIHALFDVLLNDKELAVAIFDFTKTAPMIRGAQPTFEDPSQSDIDAFAAAGRIIDVNIGNNQLQWGGFQEENARDIAEWLQGNITLEDALAAADARRAQSR